MQKRTTYTVEMELWLPFSKGWMKSEVFKTLQNTSRVGDLWDLEVGTSFQGAGAVTQKSCFQVLDRRHRLIEGTWSVPAMPD